MALASLRATRETEARDGEAVLPCIVGVPLPGRAVAGTTFDGSKEVALFPGDLPADPRDGARARASTSGRWRRFRGFARRGCRARRPRGEIPPAPHIRLDRALDFLIGDWLA